MSGRTFCAVLILALAPGAGCAHTSSGATQAARTRNANGRAPAAVNPDVSAADPTGFETLKRVLGETDMEVFQKRREQFVLGLGEERLTPVTP
jgi:hypothetical protein